MKAHDRQDGYFCELRVRADGGAASGGDGCEARKREGRIEEGTEAGRDGGTEGRRQFGVEGGQCGVMNISGVEATESGRSRAEDSEAVWRGGGWIYWRGLCMCI